LPKVHHSDVRPNISPQYVLNSMIGDTFKSYFNPLRSL
jgi:hypothetical protein